MMTGVGGIALHTDLSEKLHLRAEVVDRIHLQGVSLPNQPNIAEETQHDIVPTVGLTFFLR